MEIGVINAILNSIKTRVDGSVSLTLEVNPSEVDVIHKLLECYLINEKLFTVAFVKVEQ